MPITIMRASRPAKTAGWQEAVKRRVGSLRNGVVQIVVHDSRGTQIDRTERVRLDASRGRPEIPEAGEANETRH